MKLSTSRRSGVDVDKKSRNGGAVSSDQQHKAGSYCSSWINNQQPPQKHPSTEGMLGNPAVQQETGAAEVLNTAYWLAGSCWSYRIALGGAEWQISPTGPERGLVACSSLPLLGCAVPQD